jgi:hypothetical protein
LHPVPAAAYGGSSGNVSSGCHHGLVPSVEELVEDHLSRWAGNGAGAIENDVLGTDDPREIAEIFKSFCVRECGAGPAGCLFYLASAGCVLGVKLESGDDVVIKAYQVRWDAPLLAAVQAVEDSVAKGGIPCPRPLARPTQIREGRSNLAVLETWLPDPGMRPGGSAAARRVSSHGLARQITSCSGLPRMAPLANHPLRSDGDTLYGVPHSPLFDFETTATGAEWIDDIARRAKALRQKDKSTPVVAHTDWSARNVRFDDKDLLAVYDWDSVALVRESTALGQAAMTWSVTADPGGTAFPDLDSVLAYFDDYERARTSPFTSRQRRAAHGAAAYVLAYAARCEHALAVRGLARPDQDAARLSLADLGEVLIDG